MNDTRQLPVVLLHGLFGKPGNWDECVRHLAPRGPVLVPDLGLFALPAAQANVEGIGASVGDWLRTRGVERAVLVGNSLGGHVALHLAVSRPELAAALVLTGSSGLFERGFERVPRHPSREWLIDRIREVFFDGAYVTPALVDEVAAVINDRTSARQLVRIAKAAKQHPLRAELHRVRCPVLLLWGTQDQITPPAVAREFQALLPQAELRFIDRCGHAAMLEQPAAFSASVGEFLEQIAATA